MFDHDLQTIPTASRAREKFRLAGGAQPLLLVPVRVNERGPYQFILDTGAGTSILTPELADSLQIKSTGTKQGHTAGIVGYNFLRNFKIAIDYPLAH